ncbi:hypothetical protein GGE07_005973 [Sinorhizobium terangae]|uniref:glucosaminidase domain-containing protein n=1 Tax=Sinorhizobium terangae TaxID=110322 RepID=UPI00142EA0A4|nr:glucosaminidase domain-containing protein [Sinorhizobium terangae]MBB4189291.1 hypothetical protein [Sinorhizobium terangae]
MVAKGVTRQFSDDNADVYVKRFVIAAAANGATGIGAGIDYMGPETLHVGFGRTPSDHSRIVWGSKGKSANAPRWLVEAAEEGWNNPPKWALETGSGLSEDVAEDEDETFDAEEDAPISVEVPERFNIDVIRAAQTTQRRWGIPASVTLAQWALESGYGASMPPGSNNPFGIKALKGQPSVKAWTRESINGRVTRVQADFRVFASLDDAFVKHGELLGSAAVYAKVRKLAHDPDRFADALTGLYATDPNYGSLLRSIMRKNDLYAFDLRNLDDTASIEIEEVRVPSPLKQGDVDPIRVKALQRRLVELGYKLGEIDGNFGSLTAGALLAFQNDNGLPTTGVVDEVTDAALATARRRVLDEERVTAGERELAAGGSRIVLDAGRSRVLSWIAAGLGAFGIGNSAVVNASGGVATPAGGRIPDGLLPLLDEVQRLGQTTADADLTRIAASARTFIAQLNGLSLSPDVANAIAVLKSLPVETVSNNPAIARAVEAARDIATAQPDALRTVFDVLPSFFKDGSVLQTIMQGLSGVAASTLPGFGGSLAILGLGLAGRYFANRIAARRVEDHRSAGNINPLES